VDRKLTAILCADVYGYSRLIGEDEEATHRTLTSYRRLIDSLIEQHRGRFVNSAGDSVLAEFASVVNAVQCAVEIQNTLKAENASLPAERRMEFRIGINLGDVIVDGVQIYGDGVNVAVRLEARACRALRVVVMRLGIAEESHHAVAEVLGDVTAEPGDRFSGGAPVAGHRFPPFLGVKPRGDLG